MSRDFYSRPRGRRYMESGYDDARGEERYHADYRGNLDDLRHGTTRPRTRSTSRSSSRSRARLRAEVGDRELSRYGGRVGFRDDFPTVDEFEFYYRDSYYRPRQRSRSRSRTRSRSASRSPSPVAHQPGLSHPPNEGYAQRGSSPGSRSAVRGQRDWPITRARGWDSAFRRREDEDYGSRYGGARYDPEFRGREGPRYRSPERVREARFLTDRERERRYEAYDQAYPSSSRYRDRDEYFRFDSQRYGDFYRNREVEWERGRSRDPVRGRDYPRREHSPSPRFYPREARRSPEYYPSRFGSRLEEDRAYDSRSRELEAAERYRPRDTEIRSDLPTLEKKDDEPCLSPGKSEEGALTPSPEPSPPRSDNEDKGEDKDLSDIKINELNSNKQTPSQHLTANNSSKQSFKDSNHPSPALIERDSKDQPRVSASDYRIEGNRAPFTQPKDFNFNEGRVQAKEDNFNENRNNTRESILSESRTQTREPNFNENRNQPNDLRFHPPRPYPVERNFKDSRAQPNENNLNEMRNYPNERGYNDVRAYNNDNRFNEQRPRLDDGRVSCIEKASNEGRNPQGERNAEEGRNTQSERNFNEIRNQASERNFNEIRNHIGERNFNEGRTQVGERNFNESRNQSGERNFNEGRNQFGERNFNEDRTQFSERNFNEGRTQFSERNFNESRNQFGERNFDDNRNRFSERNFNEPRPQPTEIQSQSNNRNFNENRTQPNDRILDEKRNQSFERDFNQKQPHPKEDASTATLPYLNDNKVEGNRPIPEESQPQPRDPNRPVMVEYTAINTNTAQFYSFYPQDGQSNTEPANPQTTPISPPSNNIERRDTFPSAATQPFVRDQPMRPKPYTNESNHQPPPQWTMNSQSESAWGQRPPNPPNPVNSFTGRPTFNPPGTQYQTFTRPPYRPSMRPPRPEWVPRPENSWRGSIQRPPWQAPPQPQQPPEKPAYLKEFEKGLYPHPWPDKIEHDFSNRQRERMAQKSSELGIRMGLARSKFELALVGLDILKYETILNLANDPDPQD